MDRIIWHRFRTQPNVPMTQSKAPPRDDDPMKGTDLLIAKEREHIERIMKLSGEPDLQTMMVSSRHAVEHNRVAELAEAIQHQFSLRPGPDWHLIAEWADELRERAQWLAWQEEDAQPLTVKVSSTGLKEALEKHKAGFRKRILELTKELAEEVTKDAST